MTYLSASAIGAPACWQTATGRVCSWPFFPAHGAQTQIGVVHSLPSGRHMVKLRHLGASMVGPSWISLSRECPRRGRNLDRNT